MKNAMTWIKSGVTAILGGSVVLFALQNMETVQVSFLTWSVQAPRALILGSVFLVGLVIGIIIARRPKPKPAKKPASAKDQKPDEQTSAGSKTP